MDAISELMAGLSSIAERIGAISAMFHQPNIRPSSQEAAGVNEQVTRILQQAQTLQRKLTVCAAGWAPEVYRKADVHMSWVRPVIQAAAKGQIKGPILRRNLVAIFRGPQVSSIDSADLKARKKSRAQKCEILRSQAPAAVLAWGASLPPSTWEEMDRLVFNDLVKQVAIESKELVTDLPPKVQEIVSSLGREQPLSCIEEYQDFVQGINELASSAPRHHRLKRQRLYRNGNAEGHPQSASDPHSGNTVSDWSIAGMVSMPPGAKSQELQEDLSLSLKQLCFHVPDNRVLDLLKIRTTVSRQILPPITLSVPFDGNAASVFFSMPREAAFVYANEVALEQSWIDSIAW